MWPAGLSGSGDLQQHEAIYLIVLDFAPAGNAATLFFCEQTNAGRQFTRSARIRCGIDAEAAQPAELRHALAIDDREGQPGLKLVLPLQCDLVGDKGAA